MTYEDFLKNIPIKLNNQQLEAVKTIDGPILLLAVPGSGKTTVLVTRLGYMIYYKAISPSRILTLTYTVAATNDMRERFSKLFNDEMGNKLEFRTINSICAEIIKEYGRKIGKVPYELESDEKKLLSIILALYKKYDNEYPTESDLKGIKSLITYIKNMMLAEEDIKTLEKDSGCHLLSIYKGYCAELKRRNQMDYDDQMVYAHRLLGMFPWLLAYYQDKYTYICVDEAQDTSKIQHEIIAMIADKNKNLFMVGDEDQSIYGFRAAYPEALLSFEKNYPGAKVLLMEENFRSNANIVDAANIFIQKNTLRHKKSMKATKTSSSEIREIFLRNRVAQYTYLLKIARECKEQTAIIYRDNESVIPIVDLFERENVQYHIRNAELSFFSHRVVTDIQNIMRFSYDTTNVEIFEMIYYKIATYLTKQQALKACEISQKHNIPIFSAMFDYMDIKSYTLKSLKALETHFNNMRNEAPRRTINRIVKYMGYGEYMERNSLSNNKVFILNAIAERENSIDRFFKRLEELKDIIQNKKNDSQSQVILSTIHGSKGLEYDNVYMIDVVDGVFPENPPEDIKTLDNDELEKYEEERRLFYVGATRAKNNLNLLRTSDDSMLIKQLLYKKYPNEVNKKNTITIGYNKLNNGKYDKKDFYEFINNFSDGAEIVHKKYGKGIVISRDDVNMCVEFNKSRKILNLEVLFINNLIILNGN